MLLMVKGAVCFTAPDLALRSMSYGSVSPLRFRMAGIALILLGAWAATLYLADAPLRLSIREFQSCDLPIRTLAD
ncbi:MAG: hypothetical protein QM811_26345 [Pirellulales bacterium]